MEKASSPIEKSLASVSCFINSDLCSPVLPGNIFIFLIAGYEVRILLLVNAGAHYCSRPAPIHYASRLHFWRYTKTSRPSCMSILREFFPTVKSPFVSYAFLYT